MTQSKKAWLTVLVSIILFFAVAFSSIAFWPKTISALIILVVCGLLIKRFTNQEGYYGLVIVRGLAGFKLMRLIARKYRQSSRKIVDLGLGVAFGIPYVCHIYKKKFGGAALTNVAFFAFFFFAQYFGGSKVNGELWLFTLIGLLLGLSGVGFAFLASHAWKVFFVPNTPPGVTLLIPGVTVPWEALFAIAILAIVHELAHGIICVIERIKLKSSGVLLFGFLPIGAFVEPEEKELEKKTIHVRRRMLVAGSISNLLFFFVFLGLALGTGAALNASIAGVQVESVNTNSTVALGLIVGDELGLNSAGEFNSILLKEASGESTQLIVNGVEKRARLFDLVINGVEEGFPASQSFSVGEVIQGVNGETIYSSKGLSQALVGFKEGDEVIIETNKGVKSIVLGENNRIGVIIAPVQTITVTDVPKNALFYSLFSFLLIVFAFTYLLNFIVATVNLLPLFITDGHHIIQDELIHSFGESTGSKAAFALGALTLLTLLVNALPWLWK